ncbi:MAG: DUF502 domain-containing protein [Proteobacteria bacterium]|nr:DUF502 domain-containing protein [Pseudomonadota bacterium]
MAAGNPLWTTLRRYLVAGVLMWLPILATIWVVSFMIHIVDRITLSVLPPGYRPEGLMGFALPVIGVVLALAIVLVTGLLVTNLIGRRLVVWGEELVNHIPVVRTIYGGVKSFAESVLSQSNSFRKVVLLEYPRTGIWSLGFLTAEDVPEVSERLGEPHAAVYISAALNATAGYLVIVPRRQVQELQMSVDEAMKMIITCGVVVPHEAQAGQALVAEKPAA